MSRVFAGFLILLASACGNCEEDPATLPPEPSAEAEGEAQAETAPELDAAPIEAPEDGLDKERARALLEAWLAAQNAGDYEAYTALYSERFEGVKRSGERTYRYGRERWLDDRRRMFRRPMQVSAEDVRISSASEAAVIFFEQHWSAATYSDVGPKQLVLVEDEGALLIGREEMLASHILGHGEAGPPDLASFMLVVDAGGPHVLLTAEVDEGAGRGALTLASRGDPAAATRAMDPATLDASIRALIGAGIEVFGTEGATCTAIVGAPRIVHRVVPHFGTVQHWDGEFGDPPRTGAQIAVDVWELGAVGSFVAAPIEGEGCADALWARVTAEGAPLIFRPHAAAGEEREAAVRAFRGLPAHGAVQRDFRSYGAGYTGHWDEFTGGGPRVQRWHEPGSGRSVVTAVVRAGAGCGDFDAAQWGLFEDVDGELSPRTDESAPGHYEPRAIVDVDGDGLVEVVVPDGLLRANADGGYGRVIDVAPPYLDCDC